MSQKEKQRQANARKTAIRTSRADSPSSIDARSQDPNLAFRSHSYEALPMRLAELAARREQIYRAVAFGSRGRS
jgi:hypothetical protein